MENQEEKSGIQKALPWVLAAGGLIATGQGLYHGAPLLHKHFPNNQTFKHMNDYLKKVKSGGLSMNNQLYKTANNDIVDAKGNGVVNAHGEVYLYKDANGNTVDYYGNGIVDSAGNPYAYNDAQGRQVTYFGEPIMYKGANYSVTDSLGNVISSPEKVASLNALQKVANDAAIEEEQHRSFLAEHWPKIVAGIAAAGALGYGGYAYNKHRNLGPHNDPNYNFLDTLIGKSPKQEQLSMF